MKHPRPDRPSPALGMALAAIAGAAIGAFVAWLLTRDWGVIL